MGVAGFLAGFQRMPAAVGRLQPRGQRGLHRGLERLRLLRRILAGFGLPGSCCGGAGAGLRRLLLLLALFTLSDCGENPENQGQNQ